MSSRLLRMIGYVAVWSGVEIDFVEQARRMMALRMAQYNLTSGCCSAEPSLAASSISSLSWRSQ